jgi:hypothetical protein
MDILIYTITRNSSSYIQNYYDQIIRIPTLFPEHNFYLSIYENDSDDNTVELISQFDFSMFKDFYFRTEKIQANYYGSVQNSERVDLLAKSRNTAVFDCGFLDKSDYVMMIESDIFYLPDAVRKLLNFNSNYNLDADIVSSTYFWSQANRILYDTWGTRIDENSRECFLKPDWKIKEYDSYYATCNGICLYKAEPFKKGAIYKGFNERLNTFDCDTSVICEEFRKIGYDKIYINYKSKVYVSWH